MNELESVLSSAIDLTLREVDSKLRSISECAGDEPKRRERWLAIRSLQRVEVLMREALGIIT